MAMQSPLPLQTLKGSGHLLLETRAGESLTHFADGEGAGVACVDLGRPAPGEVEQFHQAGHHLVLLLGVAQPAVATEAPGEDALLGIQDQLWEETRGEGGQACYQEGTRCSGQ